MFRWLKKQKNAPEKAENTDAQDKKVLSKSLKNNRDTINTLFENVDTMLSREFHNARQPSIAFCIYYTDGVTDASLINEHIIKPLMLSEDIDPLHDVLTQVKNHVVMMNDVSQTCRIEKIIGSITYGDTLLLIDGCDSALLFSSKSFQLRSLSEPEGERVLSGPREGFTEGIMTNLSLIRRRLRTNNLKIRMITKGKHTNTSVAVLYMDNIVNKNILNELYRRLETVNIDGILDSNYIKEYIAERSFLGFNTVGTTERPDVVVGKLLEGRIALVVDGTPVVLTLPYLFIENFQSNEDYYMNTIYATLSRLLRIASFCFSVTIPAVYISLVAFHHEILPHALMLNFAAERMGAPLPAAVECFVMLILFDILRETGIRMPNHIGQAMSIVGALIIGQAAVEAKLVTAPMIIVVALSGLTILLVPRLTTASQVGRYACLILSSLLGFIGLMVGVAVIIVHIINLKSFGVPMLTQTDSLRFQEIKDIFIRAPWPKMLTRYKPLTDNIVRQTQNASRK